MATKEFYSNGKILLTSEYLVLKGAKALAQPLKLGQKLKIIEGRGSEIKWRSLNADGKEWFTANFSLWDFKAEKTSDKGIAAKITDLLKKAVRLNSEFLSTWVGVKAEATLTFDKDWGFGSSSTLVDLIAQWADIDPFELLGETFGGSGYDVACAQARKAIVYRLESDTADFEEIEWHPSFSDNLYLVYTGKKQQSASEVSDFLQNVKVSASDIREASNYTEAFQKAANLSDFNKLVDSHEAFIGKIIGKKPVKTEKFCDFRGSIKSLGAWGGDFILATSEEDPEEVREYFSNKKLDIVLPWNEIIIQ